MTGEQEAWMWNHLQYQSVNRMPWVGLFEWTDKGYLHPDGRFETEEEAKSTLHARNFGLPRQGILVGRRRIIP
jgi:hypothetical protein